VTTESESRLTDFEHTQEDFELEAERAAAGRTKGYERSVKQRERLEVSATTAVQPLIAEAIPLVAQKLDEMIQAEASKPSGDKREWFTTLEPLDTDLLAVIALRTCMDGTAQQWSIQHLEVQIGRVVEANIFGQMARELYATYHPRGGKAFDRIHKQAKEKSADFKRRLSYVKHQIGKADIIVGHEDWSDEFAKVVGTPLVSAVYASCDLFDDYTSWRGKKLTSSIDKIGFTPEIKNLIDDNNLRLDLLAPAFRPMVVLPNDWGYKQNTFGPYEDFDTAVRCPLVKNAKRAQKKRIGKAMRDGSMQECLDAINTLQRVPYRINEYTLDALKWVRGDLMDEPLRSSKFPPLTPIDVPEQTEENKSGKEAQKRWRKVMRQKLVEASHIQLETDLQEADSLVGRPFWLPHNLDTRGRVYHVPAFGHHRGDHVRGLFLFANPKPITSANLRMLYYQVATTWGGTYSDTDSRKVDKLRIDERIQWAIDNLDKLLLAGKDFVAGFDHWSQAGEPFQHLAACRELYMLQEHGFGYLSGLPIGFDGANSGLQHLSMASKWRRDGFKVNLCKEHSDAEWPEALQDCYQFIADYSSETASKMVSGECDEVDGREVEAKHRRHAAEWLSYGDGITRKVTKRNTMTWSYSVSLIGMSDQIREEIMDDITAHADDTDTPHPFGEDAGFEASFTMASINKDSIEAVIESGATGMKFLRHLADIMAADGKHMEWTSQLGFPAAQYYPKHKRKRIKAFCFDRENGVMRQRRRSVEVEQPGINLSESQDGIAPNWVHHLDSTHLMMTVNKAKEYDVTNLMVVHDSFSTDVASAQVMLDCIRATMVEMYEEECHYTALLDDCKARHSDPDMLGPQAELESIDLEIASETDEEALEELAKLREAILLRFWPEIPPKGEGDNALDVREVLESDGAFA
jgi:DNA-directed RNA polymerase